MFLSFFLPWWGASFQYEPIETEDRSLEQRRADEETLQKEGKEFHELGDEHEDFYDALISRKEQSELMEAVGELRQNKEVEWSWSAFGWNLARGIITFIFSLVAAGAIVPFVLVKPIRRFAFAGLLFAAALGLVVLILTLTVWIGTPGQDVGGEFLDFDQGVSVGTFIAMFGAVVLLGSAGFEGVLSLTRLAKVMRT